MQAYLPAQPTPFVGRAKELAEVGSRLDDPSCRLLTLSGGGGSGKTRLAIETARIAAAHYRQGATFVGLQALANPDLIAPTIARALGMSFFGDANLKTQLLHYLREKSMLLVLDNYEHLLDGATLVSDVLANADGVKVLVTSREALNLQEEWLYPLRGMSIPPSIYSESLENYEAIQLFLYHARRIQPDFNFNDEREAVIRICKTADGLPLAIELAATWLKGLSARQIAHEMQHNLDFLVTNARNVEARHRSIRAAFDQSWKLLSDAERAIFARLSVFRGGFDAEAAEQIAGATLPLLLALVEKSLIQTQTASRYSIHELLRQYGEEKLAASGEAASILTAHSRTFAAFMHRCEPSLKSADQLDTIHRIELDFENIRLAWNTLIESRQPDQINLMLDSLYQFGFIRSRFQETVEMFQRALDQPLDDEPLRGRILTRRWGYLQWWYQIDKETARAAVDQAYAIAAETGNHFEMAFAQLMTGYILISQLAYHEALPPLENSLAIFHDLHEPFYESWVLHRIGYVHSNIGDLDLSIEWTERSVTLARSTPNYVALANCLYNLGSMYLTKGDYPAGVRYCEEALIVTRRLENQVQIAHTTNLLALAALWRADFDHAEELATVGLRLMDEMNGLSFQAYPLAVLIALDSLKGDFTKTARLEAMGLEHPTNSMGQQLLAWSRAILAISTGDTATARACTLESLDISLREQARTVCTALVTCGAALIAHDQPYLAAQWMGWLAQQTDPALAWIDHWRAIRDLPESLREALGTEGFAAAWASGAVLEADSVFQNLRAVLVEPDADELLRVHEATDLLTARELDVLRLLAVGLTNPQIAERLVIGIGTVKTHTLSIYRKLDVANRTQAIVKAGEIGMIE